MYLLAELQQQCRRNMCLHMVSKTWLSCFYRASLWMLQFLRGDHKLEVFAPSFLCVWNQMPWRNLQMIVLYELLRYFDGLLESMMLWIDFSENRSDFSKAFSQFQSYASLVFNDSEVTFLKEGEATAFFVHLSIGFC